MKKGFDGARDHHGDLLPELSASATRMKYDKLIDAPLPTFDKNYPGSPFFTELGYFHAQANNVFSIQNFRDHRWRECTYRQGQHVFSMAH